ncbi:hypothetical protein NEOLEDRAFT_1064817 [Neolentinus lepideus HHB14362 ss-1]|uniref:Uncharacterized protein n=1 Tax=Neolentinus lepideus HHB14362 ss-1 TaxID=1314782 RepID=A0A165SRR2_9AGAM|nr:hypothetical protein NEOLEDRAFT_1064817 [Neolentinus lepideus HHB14362 ss-1]
MSAGPQPTPPLKSVFHPYLETRSPRGKLGHFIWRRRVWLESTFAMTMLDPWEKIVLVTLWLFLTTVIVTGTVKYLPQHLYFIQRRAVYYIMGREGNIGELVHRASAGWGAASGTEL